MAVVTDAMLQSWDHLQVYTFPPFSLLQQVITKLRQSLNTDMTLIAPFWVQRQWFPDMLELLVDVPVQLPVSQDILRQPHFHPNHQNPHVLQLHAWRLSSKPPEHKESLRKWLNSFRNAEGPPLESCISVAGPCIDDGAGPKDTRSLVLPFARCPTSSSI